jgi:hypothetical protein
MKQATNDAIKALLPQQPRRRIAGQVADHHVSQRYRMSIFMSGYQSYFPVCQPT